MLIGFVGTFFSGFIGMGGAIVNYPMLLFIPAMLGIADYTPHQVSGIVALQAFSASISGFVTIRRERVIHYPLVLWMGAAMMLGGFCGGYGAKFLSGSFINMLYAVMATIAALMMFTSKKENSAASLDKLEFSKLMACSIAFMIGLVSGIVGLGGGFLLIPVMVVILNIPLRIAIASSITIALIATTATIAGKIAAGPIPFLPAAIVVLMSMIATPLGVRTGKRISAGLLKKFAGALILAASLKIWFDVL